MDSTSPTREQPITKTTTPRSDIISTRTLQYENRLWFFMEIEEERTYYEEVLSRVIKNPRFYLDNLDNLDVFRVSFIHYYTEEIQEQQPYKETAESTERT